MRFCLILLCLLAARLSAATYYIDWDTGDDTNNGIAKATPWKRHPDMQGWGGGAFTAQPGDNFILKGGVTWPNAALSLYITDNGTEANRIYIGVDETWYTGDQYVTWVDGFGVTRQNFNYPVLDAEGAQIVDARNISGSGGGTRNNIVAIKGDYITLQGLWLKGVLINDNPAGVSNNPDSGTDHTLWISAAHHFIGQDLYMSDWVVETQLMGDVGGPVDVGSSVNDKLIDCRIWGPTNIDAQWITAPGGLHYGNGIQNFDLAQGCDFRRLVQAIWSCQDANGCAVWDGGASIDPDSHENAVNMYGTKTLRNSVVHDWVGGTCIYVVPGGGSIPGITQVYNNRVWNVAGYPISVSNSWAGSAPALEARIFNNVLVRDASSIRTGGGASNFTWRIYNNVTIGSGGGTGVANDSTAGTVLQGDNVVITTSTATAAGMTEANLYEPSSSVTGVTDEGTDLSAYFTTDAEGTTRPQGAAWDIGAHELVSGGGGSPGVIQFSPSSYDVTEGTATVTLTVTRTGGSTGAIGASYVLNDDTATAADDYTDDSGTVSFADGVTTAQEIVVTITDDGDEESTEAFTAVLSSPTGGATLGAADTATITIEDDDDNPIPLMPSLSFQAEDGLLTAGATASFTSLGGVISQATQTTTPTDGGLAQYRFTIATAGDYIVRITLFAEATSNDSLFLNIDADATTTPTHIWDILPLTEGFEARDSNWRGSGTFDAPEFSPKAFTLTAAEHTLYIRGREANCLIDSIEIVRVVSGTPTHRPRGAVLILP